MSISSKIRNYLLGSLGLAIVGVVAATGWLLKPTWEAYREQVKFEEAVQQVRLDDAESVKKLSSLARQAGLPPFAEAEVDKDRAVLMPFYLRAYWYCVYRGPRGQDSGEGVPATGATTSTRVYRLEIPLENYEPQTENARKLISRVGQVEVRNTPSGPVEEPALPLEGEEARRVAFMWDFYEVISGRAGKDVRISHKIIQADAAN